MRQRVNNSTSSGEISDSPMIGVPSRTDSEDSGSGDGNKNRDDLYLFTRGQVFKKSGRRSSAPPRSFTFPMPSPGIMKLPPPSFMNYSDSGFDTPGLILSFPGHQDAFSSYQGHDNNHGYHSSSSTPGIPSALIPSLDLFPLEGADQLPMFDSTTDGTAGGTDHASSASWLQSFGIPDGSSIGFAR